MSDARFAAFDIDGTIIRWQLYHAVVEQLGKRRLLTDNEYQAIKRARMVWKRRTSPDAFMDYQRALVEVHDAAISRVSWDDYQAAITHVVDEYADQTYVYTRDLYKNLKSQGYLLFAISASQQEIVGLIAGKFGFDDWRGSAYEHDAAGFSGAKTVLKGEIKPLALQELMTKHGAGFAGSIAVGDSGSDIQMLECVEQPIAFNPDTVLYQHARSKGWKIVVERKNMWYELEQGDGSTYLLAQTNAG